MTADKNNPWRISEFDHPDHGWKWTASEVRWIEAVSPGPRLELFARRKRGDWHTWGNEVPCDVSMGHNAELTGARSASE